MGGNGMPATVQTPPGHTIYPGKTWGEVSPNIGKYHPVKADLAKSKEYMDKALAETGFASVADLPEFELLTSEDPQNPKMVTPYVLSVLTQELGLKVKLKQVTGPDFWSVLLEPALGFDMAITGWGPDFDDPFTYMGYWVSSSKDMGATFDNAEYDAILDRANAETDLVKRAEILGEAEALFADIGPSVPFVFYKGVVAVQPWVKDLLFSVFGVNVNYVYADIAEVIASAGGGPAPPAARKPAHARLHPPPPGDRARRDLRPGDDHLLPACASSPATPSPARASPPRSGRACTPTTASISRWSSST